MLEATNTKEKVAAEQFYSPEFLASRSTYASDHLCLLFPCFGSLFL